MSPSDNASGAFSGQAHISRRGRPGLRLVIWRAVWPMLQFNPVMAAKYAAMTRAADTAAADAGPQQPTAAQAAARVRRAKARVACAASLLRWIYCIVVHDTSWDPAVASGAASRHDDAGTRPEPPPLTIRTEPPAGSSPLAGARCSPCLTIVRAAAEQKQTNGA